MVLRQRRNAFTNTIACTTNDRKPSRSIGGVLPSESVMQDLNDIKYFVTLIEHRTFSAASRVLGIAKSRLSFRIARLEQNLGVRLIHRTTRRSHVTDIGRRYYEQCLQILAAAEQAQSLVDTARGNLQGRIRVGCSFMFAPLLLKVVIDYLKHQPSVDIELGICNNQADVIESGFDVVFRLRDSVKDSTMVMRQLGTLRQTLVASPQLIDKHGEPKAPADLRKLPSVAIESANGRHFYNFQNAGGEVTHVEHQPRLLSDDLQILRQAMLSGIGIAQLPNFVCKPLIEQRHVVHLLPDWTLACGNVHAMYPSRHGVVPALHCFINYTAEHLPNVLANVEHDFEASMTCNNVCLEDGD
jgi:DNA-binding transcriptional LysR family regulator